MKLSVGELLVLVSQIVPILRTHGVIDAQGNFVKVDPSEYVAVASAVEAQLKADGVVIPAKVDLVIKSLPLIFALVG